MAIDLTSLKKGYAVKIGDRRGFNAYPPVIIPNYLKFTAEQANSTVKYNELAGTTA